MTTWVPAIASVLGTLGLGGVIVAAMTLRQTRRKLEAEANKSSGDAASVLTSSAISLLEPLRAQISTLSAQTATRNVYIELLRGQLRAAGLEPLGDPSDTSSVDLTRSDKT